MIDGILESYATMEPAMKIFVTLGSVSSCVLFIQMIFLLIFGGDVDFELGEVGEGGGTGIFSIRSVGSFFVGFGWTGAMLLERGHNLGVATIGATVMGSIILVGFIAMMRWLQNLKADGTVNYQNAIGNIGRSMFVFRQKKGIGQIEVQL